MDEISRKQEKQRLLEQEINEIKEKNKDIEKKNAIHLQTIINEKK